MLRWQSESLRLLAEVSSFGQGFFQPHTSSRGVTSGDESAARGRAHRRSGIGINETNTLAGETIQVWGLIIRTTVAAQITITKIVGEDEQNVWRARRFGHTVSCPGDCRAGKSGAGDCGPC